MVFEFKFPDVGEGITEGTIVKWKVKQVEKVNSDQIIAEVETDKAVVEIPSPKKGTILKLYHKEGETINVGTGRAISVKDLVSIISKILSKSVKISVDNSRLRPFDVNVLECDYSKAKNLLKWSPEISLEDGLKITIEWVKNNDIKFQEPFTGFRSLYRVY